MRRSEIFGLQEGDYGEEASSTIQFMVQLKTISSKGHFKKQNTIFT
jgi:hypothetical protein